jgi:hypothetical protein
LYWDLLLWKVPARLYWDLLTNGWYQPACQILRVWVLGFGDVVVPAFNDAIAAEQYTRFAACELVLGVFCCVAVWCTRKCLHGFLKSGFFTGFSYKFCKWCSPKVPLLLINLSLLSAFSASFVSLIVLHSRRRRRRRRRRRVSLLLLRIVMPWLLLFENLQ